MDTPISADEAWMADVAAFDAPNAPPRTLANFRVWALRLAPENRDPRKLEECWNAYCQRIGLRAPSARAMAIAEREIAECRAILSGRQ